jgi:hypothetical protein
MPLFIDDTPISKKDLLVMYGLSESVIPKNHKKQLLTLAPNLYTIDPDPENNGRIIKPDSFNLKPYYTLSSKNSGSHFLRYSKSNYRTPKGEMIFATKILTYKEVTFTIQDEDEFIWFFLHPEFFKESPFREEGMGYTYQVLNLQANAAEKNETIKKKTEAANFIYSENQSILELRKLLKGFGVGSVDELSNEEVQNRLYSIADYSPYDFLNKIKNKSVQFDGTIQDAIDKGIITQKNSNGIIIWKLNNREICGVPQGAEPFRFLKDQVLMKMEELWQEIINSLNNVNQESILESSAMDKYFKEVKIPESSTLVPEASKGISKVEADKNHDKTIKRLAKYDPHSPNFSELSHLDQNRWHELAEEIKEFRKNNVVV